MKPNSIENLKLIELTANEQLQITGGNADNLIAIAAVQAADGSKIKTTNDNAGSQL